MINKERRVLINIITALSITAILTVGIVIAIFYVNTLFDNGGLQDGQAMNSAYASRMNGDLIKELNNNGYKYIAKDGKAKLLGLSDEELSNSMDSELIIPYEINNGDLIYEVTEIDDGAFKDRLKEYGIKRVEIPETIENIGLEAFKGNDLEEVVLPNSIKTIGRGAFQDNRLKDVELPKELLTLSDDVFRGNILENISIPDKVEEIGEHSFSDNKIEFIDLGKSVKSIKDYSFANNLLKDLIIPDSVGNIAKGAFANNKIMRVSLSEGVSIDDEAIDGRFGDAYYFSLEEGGTYIREDEYLYTWKILS